MALCLSGTLLTPRMVSKPALSTQENVNLNSSPNLSNVNEILAINCDKYKIEKKCKLMQLLNYEKMRLLQAFTLE